MAARSSRGLLIAAIIWLVILAMLAVAYRFLVHPALVRKLKHETGSESRYHHQVNLALDSFSGYAILRSPRVRDQLARQGIKLDFEDDGADYIARIKALRAGKAQMAVFTIDSYLTAGVAIGDFPGSIVLIIDESAGADAIVAYKEGVSSLGDLNRGDARIVLTPASPSEFLARVALAHFNLPDISKKWMIKADGAEAVYNRFRTAKHSEPRAYVLWAPYVSRALEESGAITLLDSSRLRGYIVDVLVARREFLRENPRIVMAVVEAYLRAAYQYQHGDDLVNLLVQDAEESGVRGIGKKQARELAKRIAWRNTIENYMYFGLTPLAGQDGMQHIEDMVLRINDVLLKTGAYEKDPLDGKAHILYYDGILRDLKDARFHPGRMINILSDDTGADEVFEQVHDEVAVPALNDQAWDNLVEVGEMRAPPISFGRGNARLSLGGRRGLEALAGTLRSFPQYYVWVIGHARAEGDPEANLALAQSRAKAAADYLVSQGIPPQRLRVEAAQPAGRAGEAQSVSFMIGQEPY